MTTKVVHFKKEPYDVFIGRPTIWGNPFTHLPCNHVADFMVETRQEAINKYREWLTNKVNNEPEFKTKLMELDGKTLGCWCRPQACHGDAIIEVINMINLGII